MSVGLLSDIIKKIRLLTVSANTFQLSDSQIIDYINSYYLYDFPAQFRSLKLKDTYTFNTIRGIDTYPFDYENWSTIEMPVTCANRNLPLYQNPNVFWGLNFNWQFSQNFATGNGTSGEITGAITGITQATNAVVTSANHGLSTGNIIIISGVVGMTQVNGVQFTITVVNTNSFQLNVDSTAYGLYISDGTWSTSSYQGTLSNTPIVRSYNNNPAVKTATCPTGVFPAGTPPSFAPTAGGYPNIGRVQNILITANLALGSTLNVTDDGNGNLIGDCTSGTINYNSGVIANLTFTQSIPSGENINAQYNPVPLNIPQSIMFYQQQFVLRPVPDKGYTVKMVGYRLPSQALLGTTSTTSPNMNGVPELREWWEVICFGVSKKIYQDRIDNEGVETMDRWLKEAILNAETRTYAQLGKQRIGTMFSDQLTNNGNTFGANWGSGQGN